MHPCLSIPEIQSLICGFIREVYVHPRATLASLARTCQAFKEPALTSLWSEMCTISPLIECLPQDAWSKVADPDAFWRRTTVLQRGLTASDVEIIKKYRWRIRILHVATAHLQPSSLQALCSFFPDSLLPNLARLDWTSGHDNDILNFRYFLGKRLQYIRFQGELAPPQLTLMNALPIMLSPATLRHFHIRTNNGQGHIQCLATNFDTWKALRSLSIPGATAVVLAQIAQLPNLYGLALGQDVDLDQLNELEQPFPLAPFSVLRYLTITGPPSYVTRLLPLFRNAKLIKVAFASSADDLTTKHEWRECMETINKYVNHASLQSLCLEYDELEALNPPLCFLDIIAPILGFRALRKVGIRLSSALCLSTDCTRKIAEAWPNITSLHITSPDDSSRLSHTMLSSLVPLADGCLKLRRLSLYVNAHSFDDRLDLQMSLRKGELDISNPALTFFDVGYSPISRKEFVATFLWKVFPHIAHIRSARDDGVDQKYHERWQKVGQVLLPLLRSTQRQEQNRLRRGKNIVEPVEVDKDAQRLDDFWTYSGDESENGSDGGFTDEGFLDETEDSSDCSD
ncbi:hypothetical protein P691DRAFT_723228 [Macrolepiota fuliginosa MF-IS2]|uniref:F-box domain-containing protein n=1 Tax=Macrolepiota fuliginosa MF-IS2 TaxID=1400762 RepID=A0A9P5XLN7_9AGAR|nr:hypothetical protein P691DRAFT_723228 [Macrolepiota fuliginosa MF-IS2]